MLNPELTRVWLRESVGMVLSLKPAMFAELPVAVQVNNDPTTFDKR